MTSAFDLHRRTQRVIAANPALSGTRKTGLVIVLTGHGKGKSTAAFGMAWRAIARNMKVGVVQFIGSEPPCAELQTLGQQPLCEFKVFGTGCDWEKPARTESRAHALAAWLEAKRMMADPAIQLLILDEVHPMLHHQFLKLDTVLRALQRRSADLHVVLTGRHAPYELRDHADLVTDMQPAKHPYPAICAQAGIEF